MIKISPSVLAADLSKLADEVAEINAAGADMVHLDVMDGRFVTNISFGLPVIEALRKHSDMVFDVHLMIVEPERYAERFIAAGADILTFHYEATENPAALLDAIRAAGCRASISIKPNTPASVLFPLLDKCDMVLVMTVEPGFGGQSFMADMMPKVEAIKAEINRRGLNVLIEADGGIGDATIAEVARAGVDVSVAGTAVFKAENPSQAIKRLAAY